MGRIDLKIYRSPLQCPIFWFCLAVLSILLLAPAAGAAKTVYVIPVEGTVDPGMAAFIERARRDVSKDPDHPLVVLEMDTFGGRVDSALEIVDTLLTLPPEQTVAFVEKKAISAGALISLSCGSLVMRPATTIGDSAPISYSQEGAEMLGEKFQSPIRAKFRALAIRNGYPVDLAEAMVTPEKEVFAVEMNGKREFLNEKEYADLTDAEKKAITFKKTVVAKGELLTLHAEEAVELGFAKMIADSIPDMLSKMGLAEAKVVRIEQTWSESMVRMIGAISPILIMIGLAALYMEMKAPGFGLPGLIGILCLGIVFFNQYLVGLANYSELLILIAGLVLMGFEVFVLPGFGIAGFAGIVLIAVGMVLSFQNFVIPNPSIPWEMDLFIHNIIIVLGAYLFAFLVGLFFIRYIFPLLSKAFEGPYLTTTLKDAHADSSEIGNIRPGDTGVALTFLRPAGKMKIGDNVYDVVTENEFLEKGTPLVVLSVKRNRIVVAGSKAA